MKNLQRLSAIALLALLCVGCGGKKTNTTPSITISKSEFLIAASDNSVVVAKFDITDDWTTSIEYAGTSNDWLSATLKGDAGSGVQLTMTAKENSSNSNRMAYVYVKYADKSHKLTVEQAGAEPDFLPGHIKENYSLVWNDEFDGTTVDMAKWNYRAEGSVRNHATVNRRTIHVDGQGHVVIQVIKDDNGKYFVGQLGTDGIFNTKFGYFECRAMMNKGIGPHVAFWLQSGTMGVVGDPQKNGVEIDIFEYHRKEPDIVHFNLHWDGYGADHKQAGKKVTYPDIKEGFHTFGLEWTEDKYTFYVDGVEMWSTTDAVSHKEEYMILSTELTGFGGMPAQGKYPDSVIFDYVRVYQQK